MNEKYKNTVIESAHTHTHTHNITLYNGPSINVRSLARSVNFVQTAGVSSKFLLPSPFSFGFSFPYVGFLNPKIPYLSHILFGYTLISVIYLSFLVFFFYNFSSTSLLLLFCMFLSYPLIQCSYLYDRLLQSQQNFALLFAEFPSSVFSFDRQHLVHSLTTMSTAFLTAIAVILCILFRILNVNSQPLKPSVWCLDQQFLDCLYKIAPVLKEP